MRYGSVCSGIEAATVAWEPLGWEAAFFAEIEKFPRAVLAHHYPDVPRHGDFTRLDGKQDGPIDLLVGGTPCQSFSVAGGRAGLDDARGNLAMEFLALAGRTRPKWLVFENVPGLPSSWSGDGAPGAADPPDDLEKGEEREVVECVEYDETSDFWTFHLALRELGYGVAYRILDAQHFGVPQRRRRVFLIGYFGDWRPAAAVLFERESLSGNPPPRRKTGAGVAPILEAGARTNGDGRRDGDGIGSPGDPMYSLQSTHQHAVAYGGNDPGPHGAASGHLIAPALTKNYGKQPDNSDTDNGPMLIAYGGNDTRGPIETATAVNAHGGPHGRQGFESETFIAQTLRARDGAKGVDSDATDTLIAYSLRADGFDASEDGAGPGAPLVFSIGGRERGDDGRGYGREPHISEIAGAVDTVKPDRVLAESAVRRLTPRECERLQGFPDDYTRIPARRYQRRKITRLRPADRWERDGDGWMLMAADGPRYKALGNSMAVPVMRWIGERIEMVEAILRPDNRQPPLPASPRLGEELNSRGAA